MFYSIEIVNRFLCASYHCSGFLEPYIVEKRISEAISCLRSFTPDRTPRHTGSEPIT